MFDAYLYFTFIGAGVATGIAIVGFICLKLWDRRQGKQQTKKEAGKRNAII